MTKFRLIVMLCIVLLAIIPGTDAQWIPEMPFDRTLTLTGWLQVIYGDPLPGIEAEPRYLVILQDETGAILAQLKMDENAARELSGQHVRVTGNSRSLMGAQRLAPQVIEVESIQAIGVGQGELIFPAVIISGSQRWVNLLCKFADDPSEPAPPAYYNTLLGDDYPNLSHYWRQISFNNINLMGSTTTSQWYTLPHSNSYYVQDLTNIDLNALKTDCAAAADAEIYYPDFRGINLIFNGSLGCCVYGGGANLELDGQTRFYYTTWISFGGVQSEATFAHEMGHGFGFPHSSGPSWNPPTGFDVYTSFWDVMSSPVGACLYFDNDFGCIPPGTISYHLDKVGWIPPSQRAFVFIGEDKTVTLEQLRLPQSLTNMLIANVPIGNSSRHFYTVEARRQTGYDQKVPGQAVIIHDVYKMREGGAADALVVDGDTNMDVNDAGAMWTPGETFTDAANHISVQVLSAGTTSFTVRIINNSTPITTPEPPENPRTSATADSITLEWDDDSYVEEGFKIYKLVGMNFVYLATVGANITSFTDHNLDCGVEYNYRIASYKAANESELTGFISGWTNPCAPILNIPLPDAIFETRSPTLRWFEMRGAHHYEVRLGMSSPPQLVADDVQALSYETTSLSTGEYYWQIRAINIVGGASEWSELRTFQYGSAPDAAPYLHYFDTVTTLTWNRVSYATHYHLQVARDLNFTDVAYENTFIVGLEDTPALENGVYYWRVRAYNGITPSVWSKPERFKVSVE